MGARLMYNRLRIRELMKNGFYLTDGAHFKLVIENKKRKNFKYGGFSGRGIR